MLGKVFERFVEKSSISVMVRGILERVLTGLMVAERKTVSDICYRLSQSCLRTKLRSFLS